MSPTITTLAVQKRNPKRVNVYLDGAYAFPLELSVALESGLKRGQELSDQEIAHLTAVDDFQKAYNRALVLLSYRPRSAAEVRRNLASKKIAPPVIEEVIARLTENGLLDDAAFARFWVENRAAFSPRGGRLLTQELRQKGVDVDEIGAALPEDEAESAAQAARRKARSLTRLDYETFRQKMIPFLQRRGFGYEVAAQATAEAWREIRGT